MRLFRDAIFDGNIAVIRKLAGERPRLLNQAIDADGNTALGLALLLGEIDVVKTLLELGSDPNIANAFDGNHSLVILAKLRSEENSKTLTLAEILLSAGSNPLAEVRYQADSSNRIDATQTPSYHETPLLCSVRFQNAELLKKYIEHHADVNSLNPESGTSPLMLAAALGFRQICDILIEAGADVNAADHSGNTPLHLAAQGYGEQVAVIQQLLQRGANRKAVNEDGFTPAALAKRVDNDVCYKLLSAEPVNTPLPPAYEERPKVNDSEVFSFT